MAIKDDAPPASEEFAALLAEYEQARPSERGRRGPRVGEVVKGRIVSIGQDAAFIDLGGKSEGTLNLSEVRDAEGALTVAVGDEIEATVVSTEEGAPILRRTIGHGRGEEARAELEQAFSHGIPVEGVVSGVNKGGLEVQVSGVRGFCPMSQVDLRHVDDPAGFVGQRLTFRITRLEPGTRGRDNLVLSRRALLEEEARTRAAETRAQLAVGAVVKGTVSTLKDYGAFVDLGGIEGMLHISELGFGRVGHPKEVLAVGQPVEVQIIRMEKSDDPRRPEKISLSLKSLEKDPWSDVAERFHEGGRLKGTVTRVEPFGLFVTLAPGVEGLIHISELGGGKSLKHARQAAKVGDTMDVTVLSVDREKRRIALGTAAPADEDDGLPAAPAKAASFGTLADLFKDKKKK